MVEAYQVYGAVRELVALSGRGKLDKVGLTRAHSLMGYLLDCGFSSGEVSRLVGGRWGSASVRTYAVRSGVVDVSGKDDLLDMMAGFAGAGVDLSELEGCRAAKGALGEVGLDFVGAAKLAADLEWRGSAGDAVRLAGQLVEADRTVKEVSDRLSLEKELEGRGLTRGFQLRLLEAAKEYKDPEELLKTFNEYKGMLGISSRVGDLEERESSLEANVEELEVRKSNLEAECRARGYNIGLVNSVYVLGYTPPDLVLLRDEAEDFGGPWEVLQAIKKYRSLKQMDDEYTKVRGELEATKRELGDKRMELRAVNFTLQEMRTELSKGGDVRGVVNLLRDPRGLGLEKSDVALLVAMVLESGVKMVEGRKPLQVPSPNWDLALLKMKSLSGELRRLAE